MTTAKYSALFPHVAPRCKELIHILVHGAANLPKINNRSPRCYVTAQSKATLEEGEIGETINATNFIEGVSPQWNEMIYVDIAEDRSLTEDLIIFIIDEPTGKKIVEHRFQWQNFEPFYQYHLNLQQPLQQTSQTTCLYISMMRKLSSLSKESIRYFGLEALLNGFDSPITENLSIYAVTRIVSDFKAYRQNYLLNHNTERHGIEFKPIVGASRQDLLLPEYSYDGYPQVSLASKRSKIPIWKHDFLFCHQNEKDNMFTSNGSAMVIEFYPYQNIANSKNWRLSGLLGWTAIILDERLMNALTSTLGSEGMRTEGLLIHSDGDLAAESSKYLTAEMLFRILTERHPTRNLLLPTNSNMPALPSYCNPSGQNDVTPVYIQAPVTKKGFLPSIQISSASSSALQPPPPPPPPRSAAHVTRSPIPAPQPTFLTAPYYQPPPHYEYQQPVQVQQTATTSDNTRYRIPRINPYDLDDIPTEYRAMLGTNYPPRRDDDIEGWFDYFEREVGKYKQAIRRVIQDVMQLRDQHKTLTAANIDLRAKLENFDRKKKVFIEILEGDKIDKAKIQDIYNRLSAKISAQSLELKEKYAKINSYEKELTRRGELRAQYDALVRTSQAREVEMKLIQQRLGKADGLEETVRRQELVIEKLEAMINNYMKQKRSGGVFNDVDRKFLSEHAALGLESQQLQRRLSNGRNTALVNNHREDLVQQNLTYQQELANLKARFQENTSAWGREKAELLSKLEDVEATSATPRTRKSRPY
ncbi:unnamed protein product [Rotaria socialis]|uniref:C2 domain-containing protein n=1 Tax=Rotaria socialis TaxID=392032 RepID=A0A818HB34_9BILA|nr:unnamed protein product [Rotaria socialis]CAF4515499.1 unnamed protein product [Rotaria socialis]